MKTAAANLLFASITGVPLIAIGLASPGPYAYRLVFPGVAVLFPCTETTMTWLFAYYQSFRGSFLAAYLYYRVRV